MSHQLQIVCCRQSTGTSSDDGHLFASAFRLLGNGNRVGSGIVHRHAFQSPDIDGAVDHVAAASCLAGMLADQRTCSRKRVVLADQLHGIRIALLPDQCYVARNIHPCRTQCHTGNRLGDVAGAFAAMFDMVDIILPKALQSGQYHMSCFITDGAICGIHDIGCGVPDQIQGLQCCLACQYICHQVLQLSQSHPAGNTFTAGLGMTHFEKGKL